MNTSHKPLSRMLVITTLLMSGCGLAEYEEKMVQQQKKQDLLDEQIMHLGEPAEIPIAAAPGSNQPPIDIFFRVPKGISATPNAAWGEIFKRHDRLARPRLRPGQTPPPESPFIDVFIAAAPPGDPKEFIEKAQQPFAKDNRAEVTRVTKPSAGRAPIEYLTATIHDMGTSPTTYYVYLPQSPHARLALVFHTYKDRNTAEAMKAIDVCLQTLAFGNDAALARQNYKPS